MKTLLTFGLLSLLCLLCCSPAAAAPPAASLLNQRCCETSTRFEICPGRVKHVALQRHCSHKAILVVTVRNKPICLDGKWDYAKNLLEDFQKSGPSKVPCPKMA